MSSLGQLILNFVKIVPHGVLVFFPSYRALEVTADYWRKKNQWKAIGDAKSIFMESKGAKECQETVVKYYERIKDTRYNGTIMFAVCRGKISEGIDFANDNGRAVLITGLPFPLYTDPRVILKRQYLDEGKPVSCRELAPSRLGVVDCNGQVPFFQVGRSNMVQPADLQSYKPGHRPCHSSQKRLRSHHSLRRTIQSSVVHLSAAQLDEALGQKR